MKRIRNNMHNIPHTEITKEKIRLKSKGRIGYWLGKTLSKEHKIKIGLKSKGRKHTHSEVSKNKMREVYIKRGGIFSKPIYCIDCNKLLKNRYAKRCHSCEGKNRFKTILPNYIKKFNYNETSMRSSWEVKYAQYLDKNNIKWEYEKSRFNLGDTTYIPDFYLPETNKYIEIKGYWSKDGLEKVNKFRKIFQNININILMKEDLERIKII